MNKPRPRVLHRTLPARPRNGGTLRQWLWLWLPPMCLAVMLLSGCKVDLYSDLEESQANEMLAALSERGIAAAKERLGDKGWQVQVEQGDVGVALEALRQRGLPQEKLATMGDVFQRQGLVSTPAEERIRYIFALSQELSQTLRQIDGVMAARVHVVIPANDPLSDKFHPSSAAVFIKHSPDVDLRLLTPAVKDMVAHSIEGLSHAQVSLTLSPARRVADSAAGPSAAERGRGWSGGSGGDALVSREGQIVLLVLFALAACALAVLPLLLRRQGLTWRAWLRRVWPARQR
jgi:type III secretion protein J